MSFTKATRQAIPLIIGIAGPSGSGKTYSALRLAQGLAGGKPIAAIDTERGRMLHYADAFDFLYDELDAPFAPKHYGEKIEDALKIDPGVIIVDSFTHEWAGEGGVLDMQQAEYKRLGDREAVKVASWIKPKDEHKALLHHVLLRLPCHLILCLRAEDKIEMVKNERTNRMEVVPKKTLAGHEGWIPVTGKEVPYELTISLVVTPDNPGVPKPIKLEEHHRPLVFTDVPLDEATGERLAEWARGSAATPSAADKPGASPSPPEPAATPASEGSAPSDALESSDDASAVNAMVATLRNERIISTRQVYTVVADIRGLHPDSGKSATDILIDLVDGFGEDGELHWSPLRDSLTPEETTKLRERLGRKFAATREPVAA